MALEWVIAPIPEHLISKYKTVRRPTRIPLTKQEWFEFFDVMLLTRPDLHRDYVMKLRGKGSCCYLYGFIPKKFEDDAERMKDPTAKMWRKYAGIYRKHAKYQENQHG